MRNLWFMVMASLLLFHVSALAQRHINGQWGVTPQLGIMDRLPTTAHLSTAGQGTVIGLDLLRYGKQERYWKVAYQYDRKYYGVLGQTLSTDRHTLAFSYAPIRFTDVRRRFYLMPLMGVYGGVERINRNVLDLPEGRLLNRPTGLAGLQAAGEAEAYITSQTALFVTLQTRYLPFSTLSQFRTAGLVGVRFTFFR